MKHTITVTCFVSHHFANSARDEKMCQIVVKLFSVCPFLSHQLYTAKFCQFGGGGMMTKTERVITGYFGSSHRAATAAATCSSKVVIAAALVASVAVVVAVAAAEAA